MDIRLNNGAEVVDWKIRKGGTAERAVIGVVLARLEDNDLHPWVVWYVASDDEINFDASTGSYLSDEAVAIIEFRSRPL